MNAIKFNHPYTLSENSDEGGHSIWLEEDRATLQLKKRSEVIGEINIVESKIALTVLGKDLFFRSPMKEDIEWTVKTNLNEQLQIAVKYYFTGPTGNGYFSFLAGIGADDMRSGRMIHAYNLESHTLNISVQEKQLVIEL